MCQGRNGSRRVSLVSLREAAHARQSTAVVVKVPPSQQFLTTPCHVSTTSLPLHSVCLAGHLSECTRHSTHSPAGLQLPVTLNWPKEHVARGEPLQPLLQAVVQVVVCATGSEQFQPAALDTLVEGGLVQAAGSIVAGLPVTACM